MTVTLAISQGDWRKIFAEFIGTFFFFFFGIGSIPAALLTATEQSPTPVPLGFLYIALAHGLALAVVIATLGHISGGHFNPAVTLGLLVARKISPLLALLYLLGQIAGGLLACGTLALLLPINVWQNIGLGTPSINPNIDAANIATLITLEGILTFFLVMVVLGTVVDPRPTRISGFGIGLAFFLGILVGGPMGGGVMNPARAFTPAVISGVWNVGQIIFWVGPLLGGVLAGIVYMTIFMPRGDEEVEMAVQPTSTLVEPPLSEPGLLRD